MNGKLVKSGLLGIGHGTNDAATRAYSIDGHFIWMPTALTADGFVNVYSVTGTEFVTLSYEITKPGTYTICSFQDATVTRGTRFQTIGMVDNH